MKKENQDKWNTQKIILNQNYQNEKKKIYSKWKKDILRIWNKK